MKQLFLIRHAKSDWGTSFLTDIDRPLNNRGYTEAYFLSQWFQKNAPMPDKILSSTATRALNTALIFARTLNFDMNNFALEKNIYECTYTDFISVLQQQPSTVNSLAVFSHNPTVTEASNKLINEFFIDNIPTCGVIGINFSINDWQEIGLVKGELSFYQFPKNFKNED